MVFRLQMEEEMQNLLKKIKVSDHLLKPFKWIGVAVVFLAIAYGIAGFL